MKVSHRLCKFMLMGICSTLPIISIAEIVVVVNKANTIDALATDDVKRIFLGKLGAFPETGKPMQVLDQSSKSPVYKKFYEDIIGFKLRHLKRYRAAFMFSGRGAVPKVTGQDADVKSHIMANLNAIGYLDARYVDDAVKIVYTHQ